MVTVSRSRAPVPYMVPKTRPPPTRIATSNVAALASGPLLFLPRLDGIWSFGLLDKSVTDSNILLEFVYLITRVNSQG